MAEMTWEEAVQWMRNQPEYEQLARDCYYDDPLIGSAKRFAASDEWRAVRRLLPVVPGRVLDVGAGRGISSYAFAADGWRVTALEPDPSSLVGRGAILRLAQEAGVSIEVASQRGEVLPFEGATFDVVYGRAVLHHLSDKVSFFREVARVLKPRGVVIATREPVLNCRDELAAFLDAHPLHRLYGGENAFLLDEYLDPMRKSGFDPVAVIEPFESVINYYPLSRQEWQGRCCAPLFRLFGYRGAMWVTSEEHHFGRWLLERLAAFQSARCREPGRLFSFVGRRKG